MMMTHIRTIDKTIVVDLIYNFLQVQRLDFLLTQYIEFSFFLLNNLFDLILAISNNNYTIINSSQQNYDNPHSIVERNRDESIDSFKSDETSLKSKIYFE